MSGDVLGVIWLAGAVLVLWPVANWIMNENAPPTGNDDGEEWAVAFILATVAALLWPVALVPAASFFVWTAVRALFGIDR